MATKWKLLTFGEGSRGYRAAANRLVTQSMKLGFFDDALAVDARYLRTEFPRFWDAHATFMKANPRGFGYWVWKPFLIAETLKNLPQGWGVAYLDAGCVLNANAPARTRLESYKNHAVEHSVWATELVPQGVEDFRNLTWCKADALHRLNASSDIQEANQVQAGILMLANDSVTRRLLDEWCAVSIEDSYHFLDDSPSQIPNAPSFREHRHDQSLFNIIFRQLGLRAIPDETLFSGAWLTEGTNYPIWAPRWTYSVPFNPGNPRPLRVKLETVQRLGLTQTMKLLQRRLSDGSSDGRD